MGSRTHPADGGVSPDALSMTPPDRPEGACVNYERCGNTAPGNSMICPDCLDEARGSNG